jgi:hypothetical protein
VKDDEVWKLEERFWLEGSEVYDELLDERCVMAFLSPIGIMQGSEITRSLQGAPRWRTVAIAERTVGRPDADTIVLGYRAEGQRAGAETYTAFCTSTYRLAGESWKLVQHQQTPID